MNGMHAKAAMRRVFRYEGNDTVMVRKRRKTATTRRGWWLGHFLRRRDTAKERSMTASHRASRSSLSERVRWCRRRVLMNPRHTADEYDDKAGSRDAARRKRRLVESMQEAVRGEEGTASQTRGAVRRSVSREREAIGRFMARREEDLHTWHGRCL